MPQRALARGGTEEEDDSAVFDERTKPPPSKRSRRTNGSDASSNLGDPSLASSNDSGFLSGALATPNSVVQESIALTSVLDQFRDVAPAGGIIKCIRLKNFMCHANLVVELGKNVNFITGRNGSGKSAIMAALVLGLSGKTSTLNRGNTAKEYIRTGSAGAEISITFGNTGPEAYRPDLYGSEITIERVMSAAGSSKYKIKSARGGVISTRCDEIQSILRSYNFQLDNPMMILTQDTSRTFLNQCNPKKLFELFYRGTQLQKMDDDFEVVLQNHENLATVASHREEVIRELETDVDQLNARIRMHEQAQASRERLRFLAHELAWAKVRDAQGESDEAKSRFEELKQRNDQASAQHEEAREKELESQAKVDAEVTEFERARSALQNKRREHAEAQQLVETAQRREREKKTACDKVEREIARITTDSNSLRDYIRNAQEQQMNDENRRRRDEKAAQVQQIKDRRPELNVALQNHTNEKDQWQNSSRTHFERKEALKFELQDSSRNLNNAKKRLDELQMAKSDALARFGREAPRLAALIDEAVARGQFHRRPRGPIGASISVKDDRWAVAVESSLGRGMLCAYMVHDFHDNGVLEGLMLRAGYARSMKPNIYIRNFGDERSTYDVSRAETRGDKYPNVLSMLKFEDLVARNLLIDQRRIETTVLFENEAEMIDIMRDHAPARATSAYDVSGGNALLHPTFRFYPCSFQGGARYLVKSVDEQLRRLEPEIQQLKQEHGRIEREMGELQQQMATEEQQRMRCTSAINDCHRRMQDDDRRIRHLEAEIKDLLPANNADIHLLEQDLQENERKLNEANQALGNALAEWREQKSKLEEVQREATRQKTEEQAATNELQERQGVIDRLTGEKNRRRQATQNKRRALDDLTRGLQTASGVVGQKQENANKLLGEARELSEDRIETDRDCAIIEREMRRLEANLRRFDQESTNLDELTEERSVKTERLEKLRSYLQDIEKTSQLMERAIRMRKSGYRTIKLMAKIEVTQKFCTNLTGRQYSGKLHIDYEEKTLSIFVEPRQTDASQRASQLSGRRAQPPRRQSQVMVDRETSRTQDLRGLSGGERSYATVSFILAMWETMNAPSCCLDEFDVFMDNYARRIIMELLITFALKTRPANQFIFLTPLSVSELPFNQKGLKVLQLEAPRDRPVTTQNGADGGDQE